MPRRSVYHDARVSVSRHSSLLVNPFFATPKVKVLLFSQHIVIIQVNFLPIFFLLQFLLEWIFFPQFLSSTVNFSFFIFFSRFFRTFFSSVVFQWSNSLKLVLMLPEIFGGQFSARGRCVLEETAEESDRALLRERIPRSRRGVRLWTGRILPQQVLLSRHLYSVHQFDVRPRKLLWHGDVCTESGGHAVSHPVRWVRSHGVLRWDHGALSGWFLESGRCPLSGRSGKKTISCVSKKKTLFDVQYYLLLSAFSSFSYSRFIHQNFFLFSYF